MEKMIQEVSDNVLLYIDKEFKIEYFKGQLIIQNNTKKQTILLYNIGIKKSLCKFTYLERLLRLQPRYISRIAKSYFLISFNKGLYIYDIGKNEIKLLYTYSKGTNNPLHFCQYKREGMDEIVFGDYGGHDTNGCVGIYRFKVQNLEFNCNVEEIAFINGNDIDHIHSVEYDGFRDCYWIFTGDDDKGSCIWKMSYSTNKPIKYLYGRQLFRCCVAFITEKKIIYATDSPNNQNYLIEIDINSKKIKKLKKIAGSCIYGTKVYGKNDFYCFSTTVEPSTDMSRLRYIFTYKLGKGIQDRYAHLYIGNQDYIEEVFKIKKDILPMLLFQFGNIIFPNQHVKDYIYFYLQGTRCKAKTMRLPLQKGD